MESAMAQMLRDAERDEQVRESVMNRIHAPLVPGHNQMSQEQLARITANRLAPDQEQERYDCARAALTPEFLRIRSETNA